MNIDTDTISRIQLPNLEYITHTQPHRLYADNEGCRLEIRTRTIRLFMGEVSGKSGVILGMTHSWAGGSQTQTFFLNSEGDIYSIGQYSGLSRVDMDIILLYMLLNPLEYIDGWVHQDIDQAKKEQAIDTYSMIGLQSQWGKTSTYHPDLEEKIQASVAQLQSIV